MTRSWILAGLLATTLSIAPTPMLAQSVQEQLRQLAAQNAELAQRIAELESQIATTTATVRIPRHPTGYSSNIRPSVPRSSDRSAVVV